MGKVDKKFLKKQKRAQKVANKREPTLKRGFTKEERRYGSYRLYLIIAIIILVSIFVFWQLQ